MTERMAYREIRIWPPEKKVKETEPAKPVQKPDVAELKKIAAHLPGPCLCPMGVMPMSLIITDPMICGCPCHGFK